MQQVRPWKSVVTRVALVLVLGGVVASAGLSLLEWHRTQSVLRMDLAHRTTITIRNLQSVLHGVDIARDREAVHAVLGAFVSGEDHVRAGRITVPGPEPVLVGDWSAAGQDAALWQLSDLGTTRSGGVALDRMTRVEAPCRAHDQAVEIALLIDGPAAAGAMRRQLYTGLGAMWLMLAVITLLGSLALRRFLTGPLAETSEMVAMDVGPEPFARLAQRQSGEFRRLSGAIADMLRRIAETSRQLADSEDQYARLYEKAPTALISVDGGGRIVAANRQAAQLLAAESPEALRGQAADPFVAPADRARWRQVIDRMVIHDTTACELRLRIGDRDIDCNVQAVADRDEDGGLRSYRFSLADVSQAKELRRRFEHQTRLLHLVIDHMSDAILLVDADGRVAAFNQKLTRLLHARPEALSGAAFDSATFWDELGVANKEQFVTRMRQIEAEASHAAQERFETRAGLLLFQGIPVHDATGEAVGRLWVVQTTETGENSRRLIREQDEQVHILKQVSTSLDSAYTVEGVMASAAEQLFAGMSPAAVGLAVRDDEAGNRCRQVLHRGDGAYLLEPNRELLSAIATDLMPRVLGSREAALWTDLSGNAPWARAARAAGFTCLAAVVLRGTADAQGILWMAQRGGEWLRRNHIVLLETIAPLLGSRLQIAQLARNMQHADMTDPVTGLPSREHFEHLLSQHCRRHAPRAAVVVVHVDHFAQVNDALGHDGANAALKDLADGILGKLRRNTYLARSTGPAFSILLPNADTDQAVPLAERVRGVFADYAVPALGPEHRLTASIGIAACPADGLNPFDARDAALVRVDRAKQQGCDRVVCHGPAMPARDAG